MANIRDLNGFQVVNNPPNQKPNVRNINTVNSASSFPTNEPPEIKRSFVEKLGLLGNKVGNVTGGNVIGDFIGTKIAEHTGAAKEVKNDAPILHQGKEIVAGGNPDKTLFEAPTAGQVAGDALKAATTIASVALPGASGLGGKILEGSVLGYLSDVSQNAIDEQGKPFKPGFGTVLGAGLPIVSKVLGTALKATLGTTTGVGMRVLDRAVDNPEEVFSAMKRYGTDESKIGLVDQAKEALRGYLGKRNAEFAEGVGKTTFNKSFSKQEIVDQFTNEVKQFKGKVTADGIKFNSTSLTAADQSNLNKFWTELRSWKDFTPTGIEDLRQAIGNHISEFKVAGATRADVPLGNLKKFVTSGLEERAPGYKKILSDYGEKSSVAKELASELNQTSEKSKPSTKLNSIMRLLKKDPGIVDHLTEVMGEDGANKFLNEVAGANLSNWLSAGQHANFVNGTLGAGDILALIMGHISIPQALGVAATISPKVVGAGTVATGKALKEGVGTGLRRAAIKKGSELNR